MKKIISVMFFRLSVLRSFVSVALIVVTIAMSTLPLQAQDEKEPGAWKKNLFTGGSVSFGIFNNTFLIGANPVFGYSITDYVDAALVVN